MMRRKHPAGGATTDVMADRILAARIVGDDERDRERVRHRRRVRVGCVLVVVRGRLPEVPGPRGNGPVGVGAPVGERAVERAAAGRESRRRDGVAVPCWTR